MLNLEKEIGARAMAHLLRGNQWLALAIMCKYLILNNKNMENETHRSIPLWRLKDLENTLRMAANIHNAPARDTCFKRNLMRDWHVVTNIINEYEPSQEESLSYYGTPGLVPELKQ